MWPTYLIKDFKKLTYLVTVSSESNSTIPEESDRISLLVNITLSLLFKDLAILQLLAKAENKFLIKFQKIGPQRFYKSSLYFTMKDLILVRLIRKTYSTECTKLQLQIF